MNIDTIFANPMTLFGLAVVGLCAIGLFIWFFWDKLSKKLGGAERAPVLLIKKSPRVEEENLLVDNIFYLSNDKTQEAWAFHPGAVQYQEDGSVAGLLLTHDSCMPQFPGINIDIGRMYQELKEAMRPIALSQFQKAVEEEIVKSSTTPLQEWFGLAILASVGGVLSIVIIMLLTSNLMPWG